MLLDPPTIFRPTVGNFRDGDMLLSRL